MCNTKKRLRSKLIGKTKDDKLEFWVGLVCLTVKKQIAVFLTSLILLMIFMYPLTDVNCEVILCSYHILTRDIYFFQ